MNDTDIQKLIDEGYSDDQILELMEESEPEGMGLGNAARLVLGQGLAFGGGDELEAIVRAAFSDRSYADIRDDIRGQLDTVRENDPIASTALEVLGGAITGGAGAGKALAGAGARSLAGNIARTVGAGAAAGAAEGVGSARGGVDEHLQGLLAGASIGGGLGLGGKLLGDMVGGPARREGQLMDQYLSGATPKGMAQRVEDLGPGTKLADASPQMRYGAQYLSDRPGSTQRIKGELMDRAENMEPITAGVIRQATGIEGDPAAYISRARAERSTMASERYRNLLTLPVEPTDRMQGFINVHPGAAKAAETVTRIERANEGLDPQIPLEELQKSAGYWDFFGRKLGQGAKNAVGQVDEADAPLLGSRRLIDEDLSKVTAGEIDETRRLYAEASAGINAAEDASKFMNESSANVIKLINSLDDEQKKLYAAGITEDLLKRLEKQTDLSDSAAKLINRPDMRKKMKALLGDKFDEWHKSMQGLSEQAATNQAVNSGPKTAQVMLQHENMSQPANIASSVLGGNFGEAARGVLGKASSGLDDKTAEAFASALLMPSGEIDSTLSAMLARGQYPGAIGAVTGGGLTGAGGAGLLGNIEEEPRLF